MLRERLLAAVACWAVICASTTCRADAPVQDFQTWNQLQAVVGLGRVLSGLSLNLEATVRRGSPAFINGIGELDDAALTYLFLRPSVQLEVHKGVVVGLGYAYTPIYYDEVSLRAERDVREQRVWEQLTLFHTFGRFEPSARTRIEQRMRTRGPGEGDFELRLRQRFRLDVELVRETPWLFVTSDEVFFFLNHSSFPSQPSFSENRVFVGLAYKIEAVNVEIGYLNQFVGGPSASVHRVNHAVSTAIAFNFDFPERGPEGF